MYHKEKLQSTVSRFEALPCASKRSQDKEAKLRAGYFAGLKFCNSLIVEVVCARAPGGDGNIARCIGALL